MLENSKKETKYYCNDKIIIFIYLYRFIILPSLFVLYYLSEVQQTKVISLSRNLFNVYCVGIVTLYNLLIFISLYIFVINAYSFIHSLDRYQLFWKRHLEELLTCKQCQMFPGPFCSVNDCLVILSNGITIRINLQDSLFYWTF